MLESCLQDLRYGFRMLLKSRGFTAVAVLSLALGIGANTAIFTLIDAVLLKMLPVKEPQELVLLSWSARDSPEPAVPIVRSLEGTSWREGGRRTSTSFSYLAFEALRSRNQAFSSLFGFTDLGRLNIGLEGAAGFAQGQAVTGHYFTGLGVLAVAGRTLTEADDTPGAAPVAVISYGYWQRRFGGDPSAVGKAITINGAPVTIAGVTAPQFFGLSPGSEVEVSVPLALLGQVSPDRASAGRAFTGGDYWWLLVMGRLKPGLLTAILFGLAPALRATRVGPFAALRESAGTAGGGRLRLGLAKTLVVAQVALSLVLLVGAGLFVRTLVNLRSVDVGFEREGLLLFGIDPTQAGYTGARLADLYDQVQQRIESLPGVTSATMSQHLLLSGAHSIRGVAVSGYTPAANERPGVGVLVVGGRFFETMKIPMLLGRRLAAKDDEHAPRVAVANQAMVRKFWNGESGLGKSFEFGRTVTGDNVVEIVGVVKDAKYYRLKEDAPATVYLPLRQSLNNLGAMHVEVRTAGDPKALIPAVRRAVESLDKRLPLFSVKTQAEQIDQLLYQERLFAKLISFFGLLALSLACVGLYGILSYAVARRTGEIGLRMALGAQGSNIVSMVLRETLLLVAIGLALGVPAALAAAQSASGVISGLLFGLGPSDAGTLALATFVMAAVAAIAGLLPARRASRVDPMVALRRE